MKILLMKTLSAQPLFGKLLLAESLLVNDLLTDVLPKNVSLANSLLVSSLLVTFPPFLQANESLLATFRSVKLLRAKVLTASPPLVRYLCLNVLVLMF